jgi:hypothetical protein
MGLGGGLDRNVYAQSLSALYDKLVWNFKLTTDVFLIDYTICE